MFDSSAEGFREVFAPLVNPGRVLVAGEVKQTVSQQFARVVFPGKTNTLEGCLEQLGDASFIPYFRVVNVEALRNAEQSHSNLQEGPWSQQLEPAIEVHYALHMGDGLYSDFETMEDITGEMNWAGSRSIDDEVSEGDLLLGTTYFYSVSVNSKLGLDLSGLVDLDTGFEVHAASPFSGDAEYYVLYPLAVDKLTLCPVSEHRVAIGMGEYDAIRNAADLSSPPFLLTVEDAEYVRIYKSISPALCRVLVGAAQILDKYKGDLVAQRAALGKMDTPNIQSIVGRRYE